MGSDVAKDHRIAQRFEGEAVLHGDRTFPTVFHALDSLDAKRTVGRVLKEKLQFAKREIFEPIG
jgi:hypothetical protein